MRSGAGNRSAGDAENSAVVIFGTKLAPYTCYLLIVETLMMPAIARVTGPRWEDSHEGQSILQRTEIQFMALGVRRGMGRCCDADGGSRRHIAEHVTARRAFWMVVSVPVLEASDETPSS